MGYNIKIDMKSNKQIIKECGLDKKGRVTRFLTEEVERLSRPYVPGSGQYHLRNFGIANANKIGELFYPGPYAHYLYTGRKAVGASRPKGVKRKISNIPLKYHGDQKSGPKWDKRMMNDRCNEICRDVQNFINNGGK